MKTSRIKFPRRVRIHGGECGAVARALHHEAQEDALMTYERMSLTPAAVKRVLIATKERKQMSTKTTLKRIALVAVSALGFGVMTAIAPASAGNNEITSITIGTPAPARAGVQTAIPITFSGAGLQNGDENTIGARLVNPPATSATATLSWEQVPTSGPRTFAGSSDTSGDLKAGSLVASTKTSETASAIMLVEGRTQTATSGSVRANLLFTPDVSGTYQILVYGNASTFAAGLPSAVVTITTAGAPTSATLTAFGQTFAAGATNGQGLVKIDFKDANGNATVPNSTDSIDLRAQGTASATSWTIGGASAGATKSYSASDFKYGSAYAAVTNSAAETFTVSLSTSGTLAGSGVTASISMTARTPGSENVDSAAKVVPDQTVATADNTGGFSSATGTGTTPNFSTTTNLATQPLQYPVTAALTAAKAALYYGYRVVDTTGLITGFRGATFSSVTTGVEDDEVVYFSISAALGTSGSYVVYALDGVADSTVNLTVSGATAAPEKMAAGTPAVAQSAIGGSVTIQSRLTNQFGGGVSGAAVTITRSGRNATAVAINAVTDANGYVSHTYTDAGTAASVLVSDTVTFTWTNPADASTRTGSATVNFGTVTVGTVTVTGAASEDVAPTVTTNNISAGASGPNGAPVDITATVKDANGNLLAGVPVTFTLSGVKGSAIQKTTATDFTTVYTNTSGVAVTKVLGWEVGTTTVTATAGGKTGEGKINWVSPAANARVLSGTVSGNILSYKVVDRFGNPVTGAVITLSRTGTGLFGDGKSSSSVTTDKNGTADISYTGDATVVAELASATQAYSAAGKVGTTTVTAAVAGTTTGLGDTLAPAGVAKVSLAVALGTDAAAVAANAAADAAAEAIDAANAATDAANLAAEAADAATVAAEEARDAADAATAAVEELATQVATLMAALKAQITTLANTVAKIAKKVRA